MWIFDPQEATEARARVDAGLDKKTLLKLDQLFRRWTTQAFGRVHEAVQHMSHIL